jgi:hypothetical protein
MKQRRMVPRGGVEPWPNQLKVHHFFNGGFPVYLPVDPALSTRVYRAQSRGTFKAPDRFLGLPCNLMDPASAVPCLI